MMKTSTQWDIVVVGGANWDYLVRGPRLPKPGETVAGDQFEQGPGGKGANQAVAAARLDKRTAFVARVGSDPLGQLLIDRLTHVSVHCDFVIRDPVVPTGLALIMVDFQGEKQILTATGANAWLTVSDVQAAESAIADAAVLLTQLEVPLDAVRAAMQLARKHGTLVVMDAAPPVPLSDELLQLVDVLRANSIEAEVLTGIQVQDSSSAEQAARQLLNRGVRTVITQAGSEGNLLVTREGTRLYEKAAIPAVDTTGAGDAYAAALAVRLAEGADIGEAAAFANAAAALATTVVGAQAGLPKRTAVTAFANQQKNKV